MKYEEAPKVIKMLVDNYLILVKNRNNKLEEVPDAYAYKNDYYNLREMVSELL